MMSDPLLAQSAVDRLTSTTHELVIEGQSYRRRQNPHAPIHTTNPDQDARKDDPVVPSSWQLGGPILVANDSETVKSRPSERLLLVPARYAGAPSGVVTFLFPDIKAR